MPRTDLPLEELRRHRPELPAPDDLWDLWGATLDGAAERPHPFDDHEGGEAHQQRAQLGWLRSRLGAPPALPTASAERSGPRVQGI